MNKLYSNKYLLLSNNVTQKLVVKKRRWWPIVIRYILAFVICDKVNSSWLFYILNYDYFKKILEFVKDSILTIILGTLILDKQLGICLYPSSKLMRKLLL